MGVWKILDFDSGSNSLSLVFREFEFDSWLDLLEFNWLFEFETWFFNFFVEEFDLSFHFSQGNFVFSIVFGKLFLSRFFQWISRFDEVKFVSVKSKSWENSSKSFFGELFSFDSFDEIGEIEWFKFFHGLDEVSMLDFSEDS